MKIYDTNLCKFDCLAIKTCLLLYMYLNVEQVKTRPIVIMLEQLICNMSDVTLFGKQLRLLKNSSNSTVTKSMVSMMACLSSDYHHFQGNLLRGIDKETVRREGMFCFYSLLSNTLFIRKKNGSKLQSFLYIHSNLVKNSFLITLKLLLNVKCSLSL